MKTKVYLRDKKASREVPITSKTKPEIGDELINRWQNILDLTAEILNIPAALIMQITKTHMTVFLKSQNPENPYPEKGKDELGHGLYCETVIGTDKPFLIENALKNENWETNPDIELDMIAYYGLPVKWSDEEIFGTLCILDTKTNAFPDTHQRLLKSYKDMIEQDLYNLELYHHLYGFARVDSLTGIPNRLALFEALDEACDRFHDDKRPFSFTILDINSFKAVNDRFGHVEGDEVLKAVGRALDDHFKSPHFFARLGGDEFALILKDTDEKDALKAVRTFNDALKGYPLLKKHKIQFKYGIAAMTQNVTTSNKLYRQADLDLMMRSERTGYPE